VNQTDIAGYLSHVFEADRADKDDRPDDEPQHHPVPCMECRRLVWVPVGRTYVVCDDCRDETD